jgi:hypothetical protein
MKGPLKYTIFFIPIYSKTQSVVLSGDIFKMTALPGLNMRKGPHVFGIMTVPQGELKQW